MLRAGGAGAAHLCNGFLANGAETAASSKAAALKGMEEVSTMFKETGSEFLYRGAWTRA